MVLSLAILNNLVLTMSSQIGKTLAKRRIQKQENLHYYVLSTLFPLLVHLDDQHGDFLESWITYLEFDEFPDLIKYYPTIGNGTLLKQKYTTIKECTLLQDIEHFMYLTQLHFLDDTPNQILHIMSTLLLWSKRFYTTIGQYPTLYDFLTITREDLIQWEYHLDNPNTSVNPKFFGLLYYHQLCTRGRCHITCMIQVNQMTCPSVIPPTRHVCPYVSHVNCLSVIPPTRHVHPYVSHINCPSVIPPT